MNREEALKNLEGFDFEKVRKVMELLDWRWFGKDRVPTILELKIASADLFVEIYNDSKCTRVRSGGFEVLKAVNELGDEYFEIRFITENLIHGEF